MKSTKLLLEVDYMYRVSLWYNFVLLFGDVPFERLPAELKINLVLGTWYNKFLIFFS